MTKTNIIVGIAATVGLVLGIANFGKPINVAVSPTPVQVNVPEQKTPIVNVAAPEVTIQAPDVKVPATIVNVPENKQVLGAVSGPDNYFPYWGVNGVRTFHNSIGLTKATTTVCSIKSPSATSTLSFATVRFAVASTSATYVELARATTRYATTTSINTYTIVAGAQATIVASSTGSIAGDATIFPPNTYFNVKVAWDNVATSASVPSGVCKASFIEI